MDDKSRQDAAHLLECLKDVYSAYMQADSEEKNKKQGVTRLFRKWFASSDPLAAAPVHQEFLNEIGRIVTELASALEEIKQEHPQTCMDYAEKALDLMLAPKPEREKTTVDWYLMVSEYQCASLLPYASMGKLQFIRNDLLKRTPKRLMLPKQRELIESMDNLILKKASHQA
jgi:hypothetical protein